MVLLTPHRLNKLIDTGALSLTNTHVALIDVGTDEKLSTILNSSESILIGTDYYTKTAASDALRLSDFTFPQIIIRGTYIGGSDDLRQLVDSGEFNVLLSADPAVYVEINERVPWHPPLEQVASQPETIMIVFIGSQ